MDGGAGGIRTHTHRRQLSWDTSADDTTLLGTPWDLPYLEPYALLVHGPRAAYWVVVQPCGTFSVPVGTRDGDIGTPYPEASLTMEFRPSHPQGRAPRQSPGSRRTRPCTPAAQRSRGRPPASLHRTLVSGPVIVWLNGTHGVGKTTTSALVQQLIPATRVEYTGGTLVRPVTVLIQEYWHEISTGLARHGIGVQHFVLHADPDTLRERIERDPPAPSPFRMAHLEPYAEAARTWLHRGAQVVDTTHITPARAAAQIADAVKGVSGPSRGRRRRAGRRR